jgi:hypothetical protein
MQRYKGAQKPVGLGNKMLSHVLQWERSLGVLKTSGSTWEGGVSALRFAVLDHIEQGGGTSVM